MKFKRLALIFVTFCIFFTRLNASLGTIIVSKDLKAQLPISGDASSSLSNQSLSSGAIAGIIIASILATGLSAGTIYKFIKNKKNSNTGEVHKLSLIEIEALVNMPRETPEQIVDFIKSIQILTGDTSKNVEDFYDKIKDKSLKDFLSPEDIKTLSEKNTKLSINKSINSYFDESKKNQLPDMMKNTSIQNLTPRQKAEFLLKKLFFDNPEFIKYIDSSKSWVSKIFSNTNERKAKLYAALVVDVVQNTGANVEEIFDYYRMTFPLEEFESVKTRTAMPTTSEETEALQMTKAYEAAYKTMIDVYKANVHKEVGGILKIDPNNLQVLGSINATTGNIYFKDPAKDLYYEYNPGLKQFSGAKFEGSALGKSGEKLMKFEHYLLKTPGVPEAYILVK